jgi:hypothetical protein
MTAMTIATASDDAATLAEQHTRAEIDKLLAAMLKLAVKQATFNTEAAKMKHQPAWYPAVAISVAAAAGAALATLLTKFIG